MAKNRDENEARGDALAERARWAEAREAYLLALQEKPESRLSFKLGSVLVDLKRYDEAQACFERALEGVAPGDPKHYRWHFMLGLARSRGGDLRGAITAHEAVLALKEIPGACYNLACAHAQLEEAEVALYYLERAVRNDPTFVAAARADSDFRAICGRQDFQRLLSLHDPERVADTYEVSVEAGNASRRIIYRGRRARTYWRELHTFARFLLGRDPGFRVEAKADVFTLATPYSWRAMARVIGRVRIKPGLEPPSYATGEPASMESGVARALWSEERREIETFVTSAEVTPLEARAGVAADDCPPAPPEWAALSRWRRRLETHRRGWPEWTELVTLANTASFDVVHEADRDRLICRSQPLEVDVHHERHLFSPLPGWLNALTGMATGPFHGIAGMGRWGKITRANSGDFFTVDRSVPFGRTQKIALQMNICGSLFVLDPKSMQVSALSSEGFKPIGALEDFIRYGLHHTLRGRDWYRDAYLARLDLKAFRLNVVAVAGE